MVEIWCCSCNTATPAHIHLQKSNRKTDLNTLRTLINHDTSCKNKIVWWTSFFEFFHSLKFIVWHTFQTPFYLVLFFVNTYFGVCFYKTNKKSINYLHVNVEFLHVLKNYLLHWPTKLFASKHFARFSVKFEFGLWSNCRF